MKARIYLVECLTNLHVGNGEVNFNIVDNEVERDIITNYPTIYSSGVKGALRAFFQSEGQTEETIRSLFGDENDMKGEVKFLDAKLLAQPVPNDGSHQEIDSPYRLVSPKQALKDFGYSLATYLNYNKDKMVSSVQQIRERKGITVISEEEYASYSLPVLARNRLENGRSVNLWYEEVVPYKSLFYLPICVQGDDDFYLELFHEVVADKIIQIGANASIGYGLCRLIDLEKEVIR